MIVKKARLEVARTGRRRMQEGCRCRNWLLGSAGRMVRGYPVIAVAVVDVVVAAAVEGSVNDFGEARWHVADGIAETARYSRGRRTG